MKHIKRKVKLSREEVKAIELLANIDCKTGDCDSCLFYVSNHCVLLDLAIVQEKMPMLLYKAREEFYDD